MPHASGNCAAGPVLLQAQQGDDSFAADADQRRADRQQRFIAGLAGLLREVFRVKVDTFVGSNGLPALLPVDLIYEKN